MGGHLSRPYAVCMQPDAATGPVSLFLVGLSESFARSLARYVSGDRGVALTGVAPSLKLASMLLPLTWPDVALLDWAELNGASKDALRQLRASRPGLCVICVANEPDAYRAAATEAGVDAVISKADFALEFGPLLLNLFRDRFASTGGRGG